jgi:predicted PurR-regulated permease PerM
VSLQPARRAVPPLLERSAAVAWRLLVVAAAAVALLWLVGRLLVVVIPVVVAIILVRALAPVDGWLRRRGVRPALAAAVTVLAAVVLIAGVLAATGASIASDVDDLGPTLSEGVDEVEEWLVANSPLDEAEVQRWREEAGTALGDLVSSNRNAVASGAVRAVEVLVGVILAVIVAFYVLKDRQRLWDAAVTLAPDHHHSRARRMGERAWATLGGFLRGALLLGVVESAAIGLTLLVVGADLVVPVMVLTFLGAFVPIVGAVAAGVVAALVALVTAGPVPALIVTAVVVGVQQLDNDVLAPVVYGRALRLHPLVILLGVAAGGALFGLVGTVLAVPVLAVAINVVDEARTEPSPEPEAPG